MRFLYPILPLNIAADLLTWGQRKQIVQHVMKLKKELLIGL